MGSIAKERQTGIRIAFYFADKAFFYCLGKFYLLYCKLLRSLFFRLFSSALLLFLEKELITEP